MPDDDPYYDYHAEARERRADYIRDRQNDEDDRREAAEAAARAASADRVLITASGDRIVMDADTADWLLGPQGESLLRRMAHDREYNADDRLAAARELEHEAEAAASLSEYLAGQGEYDEVDAAAAVTGLTAADMREVNTLAGGTRPRSNCCGAAPAFELCDATGVCARCREHASFSTED